MPSRLLLAQVCAWMAYVFYVGGDFLSMWRFLVPVLPALALLLQDSAWLVVSRARLRRLTFIVVSLMLIGFSLFWLRDAGSAERRLETQIQRQAMGYWLAANTDPDDVIALSAAGAIPYYAQRPVIDMLGLNDRHIARHGAVRHRAQPAHKRYDAAYVLDRAPEFILLNVLREEGQPLGPGVDNPRTLVSNEALFAEPRFWAGYTRVTMPGLASHDVFFARNDRAAALIEAGVVEPVVAGASVR
jgi:arabinofuranosyltransferase